jgi:hypothetical protein
MSTDDFMQQRKDELVRTISDVKAQAREIELQALETARVARLTQDITAPLQDFVKDVPIEYLAAPEWDRTRDAMRDWRYVATKLQLQWTGTMTSSFGAVTAAVANTCGTALYLTSSTSEISGVKIEAVEIAEARLGEVFRQNELSVKARSSISRLGLDSQSGPGIRSPVDLLDEAQKALENPSLGEGRAASVLLPLRGCIDRCLDMLLKRRSEQEPAPRKIEALGFSCGRTTLTATFFAGLQKDYEGLNDRLSSGKDRDLPRERIIALFNQALTFLDALMSSIDEGRLKPKT